MTKIDQFLRFLLLTLLGLCLAIGAARAAPVDYGDRMFDTDPGLQWLDLTETRGLSWNEVAAGLAEGHTQATAPGQVSSA